VRAGRACRTDDFHPGLQERPIRADLCATGGRARPATSDRRSGELLPGKLLLHHQLLMLNERKLLLLLLLLHLQWFAESTGQESLHG